MPTSADHPEVLVDTSVAVPLIVSDHVSHEQVRGALIDRPRRGLAGHAAFETLSVLTRMASPHRLSATATLRAIAHNFPATRHLGADAAADLQTTLAALGISGGAVYDALVGAVAQEQDVVLVTRDRRALSTYRALDIRVELLA